MRDLLVIREEGVPAILTPRTGRLNWRQAAHQKPEYGGVYVFWWRYSIQNFLERIQNRTLHYPGPNGRALSLEIDEGTVRVASNDRLPLYVGKASSRIASRIGQHLTLKTPRTVDALNVNMVVRRMTTSCQVRDRLDRLFPEIDDTRQLAIDNLSLSYKRLDGDDSFAERFFLEDLAIGTFRPIFNVDTER